jgi:hypothetical protein
VGTGTHENITYAPDSTTDWNDYAVASTITGLAAPGVLDASLSARVGGVEALSVRLSAHDVTVLRAGTPQIVLDKAPLFPSDSHAVRVALTGQSSTINIDDRVQFVIPSTGLPETTGGIGVASERANASVSWPTFSNISVAPILPATNLPALVSPIDVTAPNALGQPNLWVLSALRPAPVVATTDALRPAASGRFAFAEYAPDQTRGWVNYRFDAIVNGLPAPGTASVYGRVGSADQVDAEIGRHWIRVLVGGGNKPAVVTSKPLPMNGSHHVSMSITANRTVVTVDGTLFATVPVTSPSTGGVALGAERHDTSPWPQFTNLALAPAS